jgi:hypothetical protein
MNYKYADMGQAFYIYFFGDDTLLFVEDIEEQAIVVHNALRLYEMCTGQLINHSKCSINVRFRLPNTHTVKDQ